MSNRINTHKDLDVIKESFRLGNNIYQVTRKFPKEEIFGITSQMRRYAVSIPSNIAEGAARNSSKEFRQFLNITLGSVSELDTQVQLSKEFGYFSYPSGIENQIVSVRKMLIGLRKSITNKTIDHTSQITYHT